MRQWGQNRLGRYFRCSRMTSGGAFSRTGVKVVPMPRLTYRCESLIHDNLLRGPRCWGSAQRLFGLVFPSQFQQALIGILIPDIPALASRRIGPDIDLPILRFNSNNPALREFADLFKGGLGIAELEGEAGEDQQLLFAQWCVFSSAGTSHHHQHRSGGKPLKPEKVSSCSSILKSFPLMNRGYVFSLKLSDPVNAHLAHAEISRPHGPRNLSTRQRLNVQQNRSAVPGTPWNPSAPRQSLPNRCL